MRQNTVFLTEIMLGVKYVVYDKGRNSHFSPLVECFTQHNRLMFKLPCRRLVGKMIIIWLSSLMSLFFIRYKLKYYNCIEKIIQIFNFTKTQAPLLGTKIFSVWK